MSSRTLLAAGLLLQLSACSDPHQAHISLCVAEAEQRIAGQVHRMLADQMADSVTEQADGTISLRGEVVLNPGTAKELKQSFDCYIAPAEGDKPARLVNFQFNW
jgi:hypothetical protein